MNKNTDEKGIPITMSEIKEWFPELLIKPKLTKEIEK